MPASATAMTRRDDSAISPGIDPSTGNDNVPVQGPLLRVGRILGARGVKGEVRVHSDTADPRAIGSYGPLYAQDGRRMFSLTVTGASAGTLNARIAGIADRDAAEALKGLDLYLPRAALPAPAAEDYYHADLVGLAAIHADGTAFGTVVAVHDFGAGDLLEIARAGTTVLIPFTQRAVPSVDLAAGRLVVDPPAGLLDTAKPDGEEAP